MWRRDRRISPAAAVMFLVSAADAAALQRIIHQVAGKMAELRHSR